MKAIKANEIWVPQAIVGKCNIENDNLYPRFTIDHCSISQQSITPPYLLFLMRKAELAGGYYRIDTWVLQLAHNVTENV